MVKSALQFDVELLKALVQIPGVSGDEARVKQWLLNYINAQADSWLVKPRMIDLPEFQDGFMLVFGQPRTAIFAHLDTVGFTVRYDNKLVPVGSPDPPADYPVYVVENEQNFESQLIASKDGEILCLADKNIFSPGSRVSYKPNFRQDGPLITSAYLDNRAGVYNALKVAERLKDGVIVFTCYEEHRGGHASVMAHYMVQHLGVRQALISDITWVTEGVVHGKGPAISLRDSFIPRQVWLDRVLQIAKASGVPYQLEVEESGGSDGSELQRMPVAIDWCFVGAPERNAHSPNEIVHQQDLENMTNLYLALMEGL